MAWKTKDPTPAPPLEGRGYEHWLLAMAVGTGGWLWGFSVGLTVGCSWRGKPKTPPQPLP
ncbi:MAG: hypothetical protein IKH88_17110 [Prevotella sp.]|nr:hypothetical protein [Prevotella sp.]